MQRRGGGAASLSIDTQRVNLQAIEHFEESLVSALRTTVSQSEMATGARLSI